MKIIDFIKALFIPREMKRLRYMSVLFAICLFVLEMYLVMSPANSYYKRTTHDLVEKNDLYYLHSVLDIKETEDLSLLLKELQSKKIRSGSVELTDCDLAFDDLSVDKASNQAIGILQKNKDNTKWLFNNNETGINVNNDNKPLVKATTGGFILNNVNDTVVSVKEMESTDKLELISISCNDESYLQINGETTDVFVRSTTPVVSVVDNNILLDGEYTGKAVENDAKVIFYFVPNENVYLYEREYTYTNADGLVNHLLFTVNKKATTLLEVTREYSETQYPKIKDEAYYFITIAKTFVSYQANPKNIESLKVERNGQELQCATIMVPYSNAGEFTFEGLQVNDFSSYLLGKFEVGYRLIAVASIRLQLFVYIIVFTLVITLLFSLLFKKNGRLKTVKEYYNIASLANIVPAIIAFILMWINPVIVGSAYLFIFTVYYLFVLYRINNSPEIV